jgi:hypothetical protein
VSTKDISRSAVEGGRYNHNKYERNESHRHERSRLKVWLDRVRFDDEVAEASNPEPRNKVHKGFTDNLGPCYGWLASHCGERWDDVRSLLAGTFDTRKLSAWHIVNQHMLTEVEDSGIAQPFFSFRSCRFYVDDDGLLRDRGKRYYRSRNANDYKGPSLAQALAWARGRKVNDGPYKPHAWYLPEKVDRWDACKAFRGRCHISADLHRKVETTPATLIEKYSSPGFRSLGNNGWWRTYSVQHLVTDTWRYYRKMTKAEVAWWNALSYDIRSELRAPYV